MPKVYRVPAIQLDGPHLNSFWPEMFPLDYLLEMRRTMGSILFSRQYQCSPVDLSKQPLKLSWLKFRDISNEELANSVAYFGIDPAPSGDAAADYFSMSILVDCHPYLTLYKVHRLHLGPIEQMDFVATEAAVWNPRIIAIESNAAQAYFVKFAQHTTRLPIIGVNTSGNKVQRITASLSAFFESGQIFVRGYKEDGEWHPHNDVQHFIGEWTAYQENATRDDTLDSTWIALTGAVGKGHIPIASDSLSPEDIERAEQERIQRGEQTTPERRSLLQSGALSAASTRDNIYTRGLRRNRKG